MGFFVQCVVFNLALDAMPLTVSVVRFAKIIFIFVVSKGFRAFGLTYLKVFSQSLQENLTVFKERGQRIALILCIYTIGVPTPIEVLYIGVGYCIVYSLNGFVRAFL